MSIVESIKNDSALSSWLVRNYNRRFGANKSSVTDIIHDLRLKHVSDNRIMDLATATNTLAGVAW